MNAELKCIAFIVSLFLVAPVVTFIVGTYFEFVIELLSKWTGREL